MARNRIHMAMFVGAMSFALAVGGAWGGTVRASTGISLLSGLGYTSRAAEGPSVLLGAELTAYQREGSLFTGIQETRLGMHLSDVFGVDQLTNTLTLGLEGEWIRTQGPTRFTLRGRAFARHRGDEMARTLSVAGIGATGRVSGGFQVDYIENSLATFPWFQKDLEGVFQDTGSGPYYRVSAGVSAAVLPAHNLNWSQDVRWRKAVNDSESQISVTTGPEILLGPGSIALQGGILFGSEGIRPVGQARYAIRPNAAGIEFQLTASTQSLDGDGPIVYGWFGLDGDDLGVGAAVRLEEGPQGQLAPAVYFSLHPKF